MKISMNEVDYVFDTAPRGEWKVTFDYYNGWTPTFSIQAVMAELVGWNGENTITIFHSAMQNGLQEFVLIETQVDGPIVWHRVSERGYDMDAEVRLAEKVCQYLTVLTADPLDKDIPIIDLPSYGAVTKNRVKAVQRMNKDSK